MALKEKLLANEEILFESKKHWISPVRDSIVPVLLIIGAYVLGILRGDGQGPLSFIGDIIGWIQIGLVVVGAAMIIYNIIAWRSATFAVSDLRVLREEGLISKRSSATLLPSITDVKTKIPFLGSSLGYGDLEILTQGGEKGIDRFSSITQPEEFRDKVLNQKVAGTAQAPAQAAAPTPAAPSAAPETQTSAAPGADDMTTLTRLAELRDSGVISAEEYEAKKAEILSRI
ncbi:MAG TPA: SHOCT domain-containing protein [Candidatus Limnocylindria bacterium]|jgi:uncharacterized membrane protein YdbT with pleckstrin-like domain|nr:SHOCT domain-containing protein [Candidatus Limnocylindria bacterium]